MPDCQPIRGFNATRDDFTYNVTDGDVHWRERRGIDSGGQHHDGVSFNDSEASGQDHDVYGLHGSHGYVFQVSV